MSDYLQKIHHTVIKQGDVEDDVNQVYQLSTVKAVTQLIINRSQENAFLKKQSASFTTEDKQSAHQLLMDLTATTLQYQSAEKMTARNKQPDKNALAHSIADTLFYAPAEIIEPIFKVVAQLRVLRSYYTSQLEHELIEDSVYYQTLNSPQRKIMDALKAQGGCCCKE